MAPWEAGACPGAPTCTRSKRSWKSRRPAWPSRSCSCPACWPRAPASAARGNNARAMAPKLRSIITARDPAVRDTALDAVCRGASLAELLDECADLERFRRESDNLYERVRALFFLYALYRF